jgi:hypothetical protein
MAAADLSLYLPVPRATVWVHPRPKPESPLGATTRSLAARLSNLAVELSTSDSPAPSEVRRELSALAALAALCTQQAHVALASLASTNDRETSNQVMLEMLTPELPLPTIERYLAYDEYFNVVRIGLMTEEDMLAQVLVVCERLLADLPNAFLARDEIISLLVGLAIMIDADGLVEGSGFFDGPGVVDLDRPTGDSARQPPGAARYEVETSSLNQSELYRWIVGHHVYILATGYCRRFLDIGLLQVLNGEMRATQIGLAGSLLRTTTGAMWYASELSPDAYLNHVRPSMPPDGFSGEHNSDHVLLRASKEKLIRTAMTMAKAPERPWEHKLLSNIERFFEIDLEDTEAHVLLAASKVGRQASLAQNAAVGEDELPQTTAVDMLRAIGKHKQSMTSAFFRSQLKRRGYLHSGSAGADVR